MANSGGETIRDMLAGFNSMQSQLGLLPQQSGGMPLGVQINQAPPPPPVMHPGQFAAMATQQHQAAAQNTLQFAQMTRYVPPPSAPAYNPFTWGQTTAGVSGNQFNPQVANFMGGGQAQGMPNPIFSTAPQFGMYRPQGHGGGAQPFMPNVPSGFNPSLGGQAGSMFQPQYMRDFQVMRGQQGQMSAGVLGAAQGAFETGGSIAGGAIGGALGSMILPGIGTWAGEALGSWAGSAVGRGVGNMALNPLSRDLTRGRQLQNTTSPFMVSGASLDPFTGQGLSRQAGVDTARGLRHLTRDHDFARQTGFNNADIMGLTQGAADQGLLATAQGSDDIVRRMKDISKAVRVLTQITGDPDVKAAMRDLGNMRNMGFEGLHNQMGALSNRAAFARMAGVSQQSLDTNYGMPGAMMAQGVGLAGSTGYAAGISGAGMANVAISGGAFTDLQLARGGGRQGISQTLALSQIGAANQDLWMAASLTKKNGKLDFDIEAYRVAQRMNPNEVARQAEERMSSIGIKGISDLKTRMPEFKDRAAQMMSPVELQMNAFRQIENFAAASNLTFGGAATQMAGGDAAVGRVIELAHGSQSTYTGMEQQLRVQQRAARDRRAAERAQYRQPGLITRMGRGIGDAYNRSSDALGQPFADLVSGMDNNSEENSAFASGNRLVRNGEFELVRDATDRAGVEGYVRGGSFDDLARRAPRGDQSTSLLNALGASVNGTVLSAGNRRGRLAMEAAGYGTGFMAKVGALFGGGKDLTSVGRAGRAATAGINNAKPGSTATLAVLGGLQGSGAQVRGDFDVNSAVSTVAAAARGRLDRDGTFSDGSAMTMEQITQPWIEHLTREKGWSQAEAQKWVAANSDQLVTATVSEMWPHLDDKGKRAVTRAQDVGEKLGSAQTTGEMRQMARDDLSFNLREAGLSKSGYDEKTYGELLSVVGKTGGDTVARAGLRARAATGDRGAAAQLTKLNEGKSVAQVSALNAGADTLFAGLGKKAQTLLSEGASTENFADRMGKVRTGVHGTQAAQGITEGLRSVNEAIGMDGTDVGATLDKLAGMSDKDLAAKLKGNEGLLSAVKTYKKDKVKGKADAEVALSGMGGAAASELYGGAGDSAITKDIAELREMQKRAAAEEPGDATQQLFSSSVKVFADAAEDLRKATEALAVANGHPNKQSGKGWFD